jgi:hypothetical protein
MGEKAIRDLRDSAPPDHQLVLHVLVKPGSGANELREALEEYISTLSEDVQLRIQLLIEEHHFIPQ